MNDIFCRNEVSNLNLLLRNAIRGRGYLYKDVVLLIKDYCKIKGVSHLSQRINGRVEFSESEIKLISEALGVNPCEIFFNQAFTCDKQ